MHGSRLRISLVDNRPLMREVLGRQISCDDRFRLMTRSGFADALHLISSSGQPELMLIASQEGEVESVYALTRQLRAHSPGTLVFALFEDASDEVVISLLEAGVTSCANVSESWDELATQLLDVRLGRVHCSPNIVLRVFNRIRELSSCPATNPGWKSNLSSRECDVARLIAQGCTNKEIACELAISLSTTKNHVHSILTKLQLGRRRELLGHSF